MSATTTPPPARPLAKSKKDRTAISLGLVSMLLAVVALFVGPPGKDGTAGGPGPAGADGKDAYPFEFTFRMNLPSGIYTCTVHMDGHGHQSPAPAVCTPVF